jgi:protein-S-isoprenylcysteine O-methyltransferase Ste14
MTSVQNVGLPFAFYEAPRHLNKLIATGVPKLLLNMADMILLVYMVAAIWLFHRQVAREEEYLGNHYGQQYSEYCNRVRRYL